jgi:hypothetical protein
LLWESPKVILKKEVLEIRNVDGSVHIARKVKHYDDWDPPVEAYPTGRATSSLITDARYAVTHQ